MMFQVMTSIKTGVVVKQKNSSGTPQTKSVMIPAKTILDVYGFTSTEETRFVVWNQKLSLSFFTVAINDCMPVELDQNMTDANPSPAGVIENVPRLTACAW